MLPKVRRATSELYHRPIVAAWTDTSIASLFLSCEIKGQTSFELIHRRVTGAG